MLRRVVLLPLCGLALWTAVPSANAPAVQPPSAFEGRPTFKEGSDRSYFVWNDGDTWNIRWTTKGEMRTFTGTVKALGGKLHDLDRIDVDEELRVIRPGRPARVVRGPRGRVTRVAPGRGPVVAGTTNDHINLVDDGLIRWSTRTDDDIDGIRFKADDVRALTFDLRISGESRPQGVEVGRNNVHPNDNPFTVRLR